MADREVIREFLTSLGFQVDEVGAKKFADVLIGTSKLAGKAAGIIAGVAAAAEATATAFARSMEKMYYSSKRTKASVTNLQGLDYAFRQIGLSAEDAQETIESFASKIRLQPGVVAMLNSLGVPVKGRDRVSVLRDTVQALAKMPYELGSQYAGEFGIPENVFLHWVSNLEAFDTAMAKRIEMSKKARLEDDKAAEAAQRYMNILRGLWEQVEILSKKIAVNFLPVFEDFNMVVTQLLSSISEMTSNGININLKEWGEWGESLERITTQVRILWYMLKGMWDLLNDTNEANWLNSLFHVIKTFGKNAVDTLLALVEGMLALFTADWATAKTKLAKAAFGLMTGFTNGKSPFESEPSKYGNGETTPYTRPIGGAGKSSVAKSPTAASGDKASMMAGLEAAYGLPPGLLDAMWAKESSRGKKMLSPAGAKGHFGFMDPTAKEFGLTDPNNFAQSASAAAQYMHQLMARYQGDINMALAAYNGGMGKLDKRGLGGMRAETQDYYRSITRAININNETNISVNGNDAAATGRAVANAQTNVYSSTLRNTKGAIQ